MNVQISQCPHCQDTCRLEILHTIDGPAEIIDLGVGHYEAIPTYFFVVKCLSCQEISFFNDWEESNNLGNLADANVLYPKSKIKLESLPLSVQESYREAVKVRSRSVVAFSILIRRALEIICIENQAPRGDLQGKILFLARKFNFPIVIMEAANSLRILGNINAHTSIVTMSVNPQLLEDTFLIIVDYIYGIPEKINKIKGEVDIIKSKREILESSSD